MYDVTTSGSIGAGKGFVICHGKSEFQNRNCFNMKLEN